MRSAEIPFKFKNRLNKSDSQDYQNIPPTDIQEVVNKALLELMRRTLHGANQFREGTEDSKVRVSDFQVLIKPKTLAGKNLDLYFHSSSIPEDFFNHIEVTAIADKDICKNARIPSDLIENANVNKFLTDGDKSPSFEFEQSFHVMAENKIKLYHNGDFEVKEIELIYYRNPQYIQIPGAFLISGQIGQDMELELKDDLMEIVIEEAAKIKAADIESLNRQQLSDKAVEQDI